MSKRLCVDCRWYKAGQTKNTDKCVNPVFIELVSSDLVRGDVTRTHNAFCTDLREDILSCGPQASKWEPKEGVENNG